MPNQGSIRGTPHRSPRAAWLHGAVLALSAGFGCTAALAAEETWVVAVAHVPGLAEADGQGPLLQLIAALDRELDGVRLEPRVMPFARSILLTQQGAAHLQMPYVGLVENVPEGLHYGGEALGSVRFALYTRRQQTLDAEAALASEWRLTRAQLAGIGLSAEQQARFAPLLGQSWRRDQLEKIIGPQPRLGGLGYPYRIETDRAHTQALGFPAVPSSSVQSSLEKLARGRIQGYVFAPASVEREIDRLGLRAELRGVPFPDYPANWLVAKGARGDAVEPRLSAALRVLKVSGEYRRLGAAFAETPYWQPWP